MFRIKDISNLGQMSERKSKGDPSGRGNVKHVTEDTV